MIRYSHVKHTSRSPSVNTAIFFTFKFYILLTLATCYLIFLGDEQEIEELMVGLETYLVLQCPVKIYQTFPNLDYLNSF